MDPDRDANSFLTAWANRHDGECEEHKNFVLTYGRCHCYRRWLEGRLGEMEKAIRLYGQHRGRCEHYRVSIKAGGAVVAPGDCTCGFAALLPPKGAGDE